MPNNFRHQKYSAERPQTIFKLLAPPFPPQPGSAEFEEIVKGFRANIEPAVDAIYLIHGTFTGHDALGWNAQLARLFPSVGSQLNEITKKVVDWATGESGNYTDEFRSLLENAINDKGQRQIPVQLFHWCSENTHSARCRAALILLNKLIRRATSERQSRFQLWCHSHAGNVAALLTNLLGADQETRAKFFEKITPIFSADSDRQLLLDVNAFLDDPAVIQLDIITFGTPIRYGWDDSAVRHLLHFVNHYPQAGAPEFLAPLPGLSIDAIRSAQGDFVQQFGIATTNLTPFLFDKELLEAERKLGQMVQSEVDRSDFVERLKMGMRVPEAGTTLLVEYDNYKGLARQSAGHAIYTRTQWLSFHIAEIGRQLYQAN